MGTPCLEIVSFRLVSETEPSAFRAAAENTEAAVKGFGGCLGRWLVQEGETWTDYVLWESRETALAAAEVVPKDPRFAPFGQMIAGESVSMRHADIAWSMTP